MTTYQAPKDIWAVNGALQPKEPLNGDQDPCWVDTYGARGEASLEQIGQLLGVDLGERCLRDPPARGYYLFCGQRGSGKSTELRNLRNQFHHADLYHVVFADAAVELDVYNLRYQDILLHLAAKLAAQLAAADRDIDPLHLQPLYEWFTERIEKRDQIKQFAQEWKGGLEDAPSVPFLAKVFGRISIAFKTNATYKNELRLVLRNYFADFADAFNTLVTRAEEALGQRLLFVVAGTDRLRDEDAAAFFGASVVHLRQVKGLFIYCAPIHLANAGGGGAAAQGFDNVFHLPVVKVENEDGSRNEEGLRVMRQMLEKRADPSLFDDGVADRLARTSGGHPRELLRLLHYTFLYAENERFDDASADHAIRSLASDYRRFLNPEDYRVLASIDGGCDAEDGDSRLDGLLWDLALLEYKSFFKRSHPIVRTTNEYKRAVSRLGRSEASS